MNDVIVRVVELDPRVKGFIKESSDGIYNIYINSCLCPEAQRDTYRHELEHIKKNHLSSSRWVMDLEAEV